MRRLRHSSLPLLRAPSIWREGSAAASLAVTLLFPALVHAQQPPAPPPPSAARRLLLPRRAAAGDRATLAVLDVNGRLTPGVTVAFSTGARVTTDSTGRAVFTVPPATGRFSASISGRSGRVPFAVVSPSGNAAASGVAQTAPPPLTVRAVPRFASLTDRFEITGAGFCGEADANQVLIAGRPALVLAASSLALTILPPEGLAAGPAEVSLGCGDRAAAPFTLSIVSLELVASSTPLAPGERRELVLLVHGTSERIPLEARNLAPETAGLTGGNPVRLPSTGGPENSARLELRGRRRGSFLISIRLVPSYSPPHR